MAEKDKPPLLSGDNPQIAKGYGDAPVVALAHAAPSGKGPLARRVDALIVQTVSGVMKAVNGTRRSTGWRRGAGF